MAGIEWTDTTWNPVTGCTKVSPGCDHCYMFKLYPRLKSDGRRRLSDCAGRRQAYAGSTARAVVLEEAALCLCEQHVGCLPSQSSL